jgi:predicted RNA binding protein YcfA (HicA-like mRNA interferase family)
LTVGGRPTLKPRDVARLLECLGFTLVRQRGSHRQYRHDDGRRTTLPFHAGRDLSPILVRLIARDVGLTPEELLEACAKRR